MTSTVTPSDFYMLGTGLSAAALSKLVGMTPESIAVCLAVSACGAFVGLLFADSTSTLRALAVYVFVVPLSCVFGIGLAKFWLTVDPLFSWALSGAISMFFHQLYRALDKVLEKSGAILEWFLRIKR